MKSRIFQILVAISLVCVVAYLLINDLLIWPNITSWAHLLLSVGLLMAAFVFQAVNWKTILGKDFGIDLRDALVSTGLTVFTKYIPGKVFVILGKVEYIKTKYGYPYNSLISRSLDAQIITIWLGLILGSVSIFWIDDSRDWGYYVALAVLLLTAFIFTPVFHRVLQHSIRKLTGKDITVPFLSLKKTVTALPSFLVYWGLLILAFYFFSSALVDRDISLLTGFTFPLAATFGIVLIFAPGGIGAREGLLVALLHASGLELQLATTIAVSSRIWFLVGEVFLFLLGLYLHKRRNGSEIGVLD